MHVISSFHYSLHTELAVSGLIEKGINKDMIFIAPLEVRGEERKIFDTIHHADGVSIFDGGAILGTACSTLGVIYGFVLDWGPIIWGLLGFAIGFVVGVLLDYLIGKVRQSKNRRQDSMSEVIIIVQCSMNQVDMVKDYLGDHLALGLTVVP